jgi:threonine dehydratase
VTLPAPLDVAAVEAAHGRLHGAIYETPCPHSQTLSELSGSTVHLKLENLQMTGSFKERGAANLLLQLDDAERRRGVVAASAGNHGLAVAFHAARLGIPTTIVMPTYAPLIKVTSARRYGAEVILHGANYDEAYERAREVEQASGAVFVHPFDDARVVAGQGTLGLELLAQVDGLEAVVVPVGGGGLIAGVASAVDCRVVGVEPERAASLTAGLEAGEPVRIEPSSIADGLNAPFTGVGTLAVCRELVDEVVLVTEDEIAEGMRFLYTRAKLACEPAGAAAVAALLAGKIEFEQGLPVVAVVSGGNADPKVAAGILASR